MKQLLILSTILFIGCSSAEMVENWKNPDIVLFDASKVLLVGMTHNEDARVDFESRLQNEFTKRGVESMRSIDLFDVTFVDSQKSEKELDEVEEQLLDKDFDAILFTKITGSENIEVFRKKVSNWASQNRTFKEDYLGNQGIYYDDRYYDKYTVYHAETSLYCICVGKERELIWRGIIDVTDPNDIGSSIEDYVKLVVTAMEEQDLIFRKKDNEMSHNNF